MNSDQIRTAFLTYFEEKQHIVIPSSSLVPQGDPTLLLTTAGMVQIKPYFLGLAVPPGKRLASCQKCFRTTDINSVGDARHLTFFEMLGNFSVGDYFKKEAISWAWEFVTERLKVKPEKLWVSVYLDDDESFEYWRRIGFPEDKIVRLGEEDNFWGPAGDSGPCGPCSEIHYDFGVDVGCGKPECGPGCDCGRFSEIWNLVFTQYNQDKEGKRAPLPKPNIDTGMGLERTAAVMQGVSSVYDTDLFAPLLNRIAKLTGVPYGKNPDSDQAIRIVAEHSRGITFLIADGVIPSNDGRGYVLRRVLRKACFFGRKLGVDKPFLSQMAEAVIDRMGHVYPELAANKNLIHDVVKVEEEKFTSTLDAGISLVEKAVNEALKNKRKSISGEEAFRFWDTYGFPLELTVEIAREKGLDTDVEGFETEMEKQRARARAGHKFSLAPTDRIPIKDKVQKKLTSEPTKFVGHERLKSSSKVRRILDQDSGHIISSASKDQKVAVDLEETPFYGEMGGQVGDTGKIVGGSGQIDIDNTIWSPYGDLGEGAIIHLGHVVKGAISEMDPVEASVDMERRFDIARNHTATHLLQAALRQVLGRHVQQRGSLVHADGFRFDFSQLSPVSKQELDRIEHIVNERIRENLRVESEEVSYEEIKKDIESGKVIALFDEKYKDKVRVLKIGEPPISTELCGGTHVKATGEIGFFMITSESSIGTGLRRIEAVTGRKAEELVKDSLSTIKALVDELRSSPTDISQKIKGLIDELASERKRCGSLEKELAKYTVESLLDKAEKVNDITVLSAKVPSASLETLRQMGDSLKVRLKSAVIVLGTVQDGKPSFVAMVTPDLVKVGLNAGNIVKQVAAVTGGGGGGKMDMAQAGGKDKTKIDEALGIVKRLVQNEGA